MAKDDATPHYLTLRGGRMTKVAGVAASFAPTLGSLGASVSVVALGAALMLGGQASAQMVITDALTTVEDPAGNNTPIVLADPGAGNTRVGQTDPGFGIDTSNGSMGPAITLDAMDGNVSLVDDNNSNITGFAAGVYGNTSGAGNLSSQTTGIITSTNGNGIDLNGGYGASGDVTVTSTNDAGTAEVNGSSTGVAVSQRGSGMINVTVDNVNGSGNYGISAYADNNAGPVTIQANGEVVGGGNSAIRVQATRDSAISITSNNENGDAFVRSFSRDGIYANGGGANQITIVANEVTGYNNGIFARNSGGFILDSVALATPADIVGPAPTGSISVTATGDVTGGVGYGMYIAGYAIGDVTINSTNEDGNAGVYGQYGGIRAFNNYGNTTITANEVSSYSGTAIFVQQNGGGVFVDDDWPADRDFPAASASEADEEGPSSPLGNVSVTVSGPVESITGDGIIVENSGMGDVTVDATNEEGDNEVSGQNYGIYVRNSNGGNVSVSANNVSSLFESAIEVNNNRPEGMHGGDIWGGDMFKTVSIGGGFPIGAPGDVTVRTTGEVMSFYDRGIDINNRTGGDTTVDASNDEGTGQVTGGSTGIEVRNSYGGNISITADNVTGGYQDGIFANTYIDRRGMCYTCVLGALEVTTDSAPAATVAKDDPLLFGGYDITITTTGSVVGGQTILEEDRDGPIKVRGGDGIDARNSTGGSIFITSENEDGTASVEGTRHGISAYNYSYYGGIPRASMSLYPGSTGVIDIHAQHVSGALDTGIAAYNYGGGIAIGVPFHPSEDGGDYGGGIFIEVTGSVEGGLQLPTYGDYGPELEKRGPGLPIGFVGGGANGITAIQSGPGNIDIDATNDDGTVTVEGRYNGILAQNFLGDITINVDNSSGQYGAGVTASSAPFFDRPIRPRSPAAIDAELDDGPLLPVFENNITVTSTGVVEGGTELTSDLMRPLYGPLSLLRGPDGINVTNLSQGDITITSANEDGTAEANGHRSGIAAFKGGAGDITITANNVEGKNFHGIFAGSTPYFSYYYGPGRPTVTSPAAIEEEEYEPKIPEGNITISASGTVTGGQYAGVDDRVFILSPARAEAEEAEPTGNFTYDASIQYGGIGIFAAHYFTGDVNVDVTNEEGSASANGPLYGIAVANLNGGTTTITVDNATGDEGAGVAVYHDENGGDISVTTNGDVNGGQNGIRTVNDGAGSDTTISVGGVVNGDMTAGINTVGQAGTMTTITLREGADVSGGQYAILNDGSDSMVTVEDGAKLSGVTSLGGGSDALTIEGDADISGATVLDGGDEEAAEVAAIAAVDAAAGGTDVLTFSGFTGTLGAGLSLDNWEEGIFSGGDTTIALAMLDIPQVTLQDNANVSVTDPSFTLNGKTTIRSGSTLNAGVGGMGDVMLDGNVANNGLISLLDDNAGDMLGITGNMTGNGELSFDVDFAGGTNDAAEVGGNVTGQNGVNVNGTSNATEASEFTLVTVGGTNSDSSFNLANPNAVNSDGDDAIANGAFIYSLDRRAASGEFVLTPFDSAGNTQFNPSVAVFQEVPGIFTDLGGQDPFLHKFDGGSGGADGSQGGVAQALLDFGTTNDDTFYVSITGQQSDRDLTNILRTNVDTTSTQLSMGFDVPMYEGASGTLFGGFNFSYIDSDSDVTSFAGVGSVDTEAFGYTFSAFYLADSGFYVDGRYRFSFFDSSLVVASGLGALGLVTEGTANSGSLEVGKLIGLSNGLTLIPQAQVQIVSVGADPLVDPLTGTALGVISDGDTTTGRLGLWLERETARNTLFGSVSVHHDFDGTTTTNFAGIPFSSKREETRLELGVGGELSVGQNSSVFGRVFAAGGLGDWTADETYTATAGFRLNF